MHSPVPKEAVQATKEVVAMVADSKTQLINELATKTLTTNVNGFEAMYSYDEFVTNYISLYMSKTNQMVDCTTWTFESKIAYIDSNLTKMLTPETQNYFWTYKLDVSKEVTKTTEDVMSCYDQALQAGMAPAAKILAGGLYILGGAMMIYSAFNLLSTVYNYYHPDSEDIPTAMVDMIETVDGDRYIKYDVVFEAETRDDGNYSAADLNAFEAQRWNALYYTKSYEAGKPLLADEFVISHTNNKAGEGYTPVHRFGEVVCYDLNKYNFEGNTHIYLSVKQSKNNKSAVADVPEVVGSMFGTGFLLLASGIGVVFGIGGTLTTQVIKRKSKAKADAS